MQCCGKLRSHLGLLFLVLLGTNYAYAGNEEKAPEVEKNTPHDIPAKVESKKNNDETTREGRYFNINSASFINPDDNSFKGVGRYNLLDVDQVLTNTPQYRSDIKINSDDHHKARSNYVSDWEIFEIPQSLPAVKPKQAFKTITKDISRDIKSTKNGMSMYTCEFDDFVIHTSTKIDCDSIQNNGNMAKTQKKKTTRVKSRVKSGKGRVKQSQSRRQQLMRQQYNRKKQPYQQRKGYNKRVKNPNRQRMQYHPQYQYMYSMPRYTRRKTFRP